MMYCEHCGKKIEKLRYYCPNCNNDLKNNKFKFLNYFFLCHRLPERSFFYKGHQFPICARCTGILVGYIIGIFSLFLFIPESLLLAIILILPTALDGLGQLLGKWKSTNRRRFLTGIIAGIGVIFLFITLERFTYNLAVNTASKFKILFGT